MNESTNNEVGHTPGPWEHGRTDLRSYTHNPVTGDTERVMYVYRDHGQQPIQVFGDKAVEDARLIAASPDLFRACVRLLAASDFDPSVPLTPEQIHEIAGAQGDCQEAIQKATGHERL